MDWKNVQKQKPYCWETGDWDGKRSDIVLCVDEVDNNHLAHCYEGCIDGCHFFEWYDKDDFELQVEIAYWVSIENP